MNTPDWLQAIWSKSGQQEPNMDPTTINQMLDKSARSGWWALRVNVWIFLGLQIICAILELMNLVGAVDHPVWLPVHATLAVVICGFIAFSLYMFRALRAVDDSAASLATIVRRQLRFFHTTFEYWIWICSFTLWMFSFCIVAWIENQEAGYRIEHVIEFAAMSACTVLGSYALLRMGHYPMVSRSLAALQDLESQTTEETRRIQSRRKDWMIGLIVLGVALLAAVVWTFYRWLSATP